jgi:heme exporter protein A
VTAAALATQGIQRIDVRAVTCMFGVTAALRAVSVRFEAGTVTVLEGPNGAGKSTLLAVVGTLLRPTSGSVDYAPFGDNQQRARAHIGWVSHESRCYAELTARQNIELAARLYGVDPRDAWRRVGARLGAEPFADRSVGTLSRGQRQRVALARALVHRPSVLLLDEPWSGLDAASSETLNALICEERDRGAIVVVVSHEPERAARLQARTIRLERGKIAENSK